MENDPKCRLPSKAFSRADPYGFTLQSGSAVLVALGVDEEEKRTVLGTSVALSEAEVHWRAFISSLLDVVCVVCKWSLAMPTKA